jgi:D-xylose transport system permease protein
MSFRSELNQTTEHRGRRTGNGGLEKHVGPPSNLSGRGLSLVRLENLPVAASLVVVALVFQLQSHFFLTPRNLNNLAVQITPLAVVALAEVVVLLMKEIDLSLGSVAGVTAAIGSTLLANDHKGWILATVIMLACGAGIGALQGAVIVLGGVPSFVVTLAGYLACLGIQLDVLGNGGGIDITNQQILDITGVQLPEMATLIVVCAGYAVWVAVVARRLLRGRAAHKVLGIVQMASVGLLLIGGVVLFNLFGGVPLAFLLTVAVVAFVATWLKHTPAGRHVYAVGGNLEAARRAGVRVKTIRWGGFVTAGLLAAGAGLLLLSYDEGSSTLTGGGTLLLEAIGSAVVGGVSLFGGRGNAWGALFGALVLGGVENGLDLTNHAPATKYIVEGAIVLLAVLVDAMIRRRDRFRWSALRARLGVGRQPTAVRHLRTPGAPSADG